MFSIRFMLGVAVGAAGGYAFGRVVEARTMKVPLAEAFKLDNLLTPVSRLRSSVLPLKPPMVFGPGLTPTGPDVWASGAHPSDPWNTLTVEQRRQLEAFEAKYPGMNPSMRPA